LKYKCKYEYVKPSFYSLLKELHRGPWCFKHKKAYM
jgi:hypothetical protein